MSIETRENNIRIAKNTLYMYLRMLVTLIVSLFTTRIVYKTLGVDNFGIYNIVASVIVFFTFLNNGLVNATRRYFTAELANGTKESQQKVFNLSLVSHFIVALIILIVGETIGLWAVNYLLNIPEDRMMAANVLFQASLICAMVQVMQAPYTAAITSHERMSVYAYFCIFDVVFKLLIVFLLLYIPGDSLIVYGFLLLLVSICNLLIYSVYCNKHFAECRFKKPHDLSLLKEMFKFMGWNLVGQGSVILTNQGVTVLVNLFFSVAANAAMGVSNQITHIVTNFVTNFQTAFNPQITKQYVKREFDEMQLLAVRCSRFSVYLVLVFTIPIICQIRNFLSIWLGDYPEYAIEFCIYTLIGICIDSVSAPLWMILGSDKDIKKYQITISIIYAFNFIGGYFLLLLGLPPYSVIFARIAVYIVSLFARLFLVREKVPSFPYKDWLAAITIGSLKVLLIPVVTLFLLQKLEISNQYVELFVKAGISLISVVISIYAFGLTRRERLFINSKVKSVIIRSK